ncbi:hypothetical protein TARUN_7272 [Trichoderma arundinaceum]|uniref:Uncharacterized protein n=1 Tax=Trichoderma arundinaceum TaxID=490622 RepID=A0A395NG58_TRIAR|nr:hypothetical protein TARUN_7272 [Trichoderma arundinaceum]
METKDPPNRFPALSTDVFSASESAHTESPPQSPRTQLPAYGDERAPPKYQENGLTKEDEAAKKARTRKTLFVRLLTSIFVTVLVSLVVAAAVGRIQHRQAAEKKLKEEQRANETELGVKLQAENDTLKVSLTATAAALVFTVAATAAPSNS